MDEEHPACDEEQQDHVEEIKRRICMECGVDIEEEECCPDCCPQCRGEIVSRADLGNTALIGRAAASLDISVEDLVALLETDIFEMYPRNGYMEPEIVLGNWWEVEGNCGTTWIEDYGISLHPPKKPFPDLAIYQNEQLREDSKPSLAEAVDELEQYTDENPGNIYLVEYIWNGYGCRLNAPGYLDCTEWAVFETIEEAKEFLQESLDVDPRDMPML